MDKSLFFRIISAVVAAAVLLAALFLKGYYLVALCAFAIYLSLFEFNTAFKKKGYHTSFVAAWAIATPFLYNFLIAQKGFRKGSYVVIAITIMLYFLYYLFSDNTIVDFLLTIFSVIYIAVPITSLYLLVMSKYSSHYVWLVLIVTFSTDTFAFIFGKMFGKHKLIPSLSPNKTVEGSIGGLIGSVACSFLYTHFTNFPINPVALIYISLVGSIFAQIGDLFASKLKRFCGIKDFGNIMPGHGGILDRIDSLLFVAILVMSAFAFIRPHI